MLLCFWAMGGGGVYFYCGWCGDDIFVWVTFLSMRGKVWDVKDGPNISLSCDCWGLSLLSNLFFFMSCFFYVFFFVWVWWWLGCLPFWGLCDFTKCTQDSFPSFMQSWFLYSFWLWNIFFHVVPTSITLNHGTCRELQVHGELLKISLEYVAHESCIQHSSQEPMGTLS